MKKNLPLNIVVLGAGPSGLCAAWNLVQDGHNVIILEKEPVCGGQSITFQRGDYKYDLGPHNIHPQRKSIINFLKKNLGEEFLQHNYSAQIFFRGKRINYPFISIDLLKSMNFLTIINCGLSFLWSHFISFFIPKFKDDGSFKTWTINRFGRKFYNIYFGPYSEKVWGIPSDQLSDIIAKKRIAVKGIIELIHSIIFKQQQYHPENPSLIENYYPQNGVGSISDFFVEGIIKGGGEIITKATVEKIVLEQNNVTKIFYSSNGKIKCLDFNTAEINSRLKVLSTIPVNDLILKIEGVVPETVMSAAKNLDFTSEIFLYLNISRLSVFNIPLLYFSEFEFPFNRIYDVRIFSPKMVPSGKTALCLEITCNQNDELWLMDDDSLFEKCISPLEKYGLLKREEVEDYHTRRITHAYPRFRIGYEKKLNKIFSYINQLSNLISFGRQGLFAYANVDDAIWMGFEVAKHVGYSDRIALPMKELLPNYITF